MTAWELFRRSAVLALSLSYYVTLNKGGPLVVVVVLCLVFYRSPPSPFVFIFLCLTSSIHNLLRSGGRSHKWRCLCASLYDYCPSICSPMISLAPIDDCSIDAVVVVLVRHLSQLHPWSGSGRWQRRRRRIMIPSLIVWSSFVASFPISYIRIRFQQPPMNARETQVFNSEMRFWVAECLLFVCLSMFVYVCLFVHCRQSCVSPSKFLAFCMVCSRLRVCWVPP